MVYRYGILLNIGFEVNILAPLTSGPCGTGKPGLWGLNLFTPLPGLMSDKSLGHPVRTGRLVQSSPRYFNLRQ